MFRCRSYGQIKMKRLAGQAGTHLGRFLHALGLAILTFSVVVMLGLGALAFRLSRGPLEIPYLASQLANIASGHSLRVHIGAASLAWAGYAQGGAAPLYLQLGNMNVTNEDGVDIADIPDARLVFQPGALLGTKAPILVNSSDMRFQDSTVPVSLRAFIRLSSLFKLSRANLTVSLGPGVIGTGDQSEAISGGGFVLHITPGDASLTKGQLKLAPIGQSTPVVSIEGTAHLNGGHPNGTWAAQMVIGADRVAAADLSHYWPAGAAKDARHWVTTNITAGFGQNARLVFTFSAPERLSNVALTDVTGGFDGSDLTLTWLPRAPALTALNGHLAFLDADTILITAQSAKFGNLNVTGGTMKITGVDHKDQDSTVDVTLAGEVADAMAVLNQPPLSLMKQAPVELLHATGTVQARAQAELPLKKELELDDVKLAVDATLSHAAGPVPVVGLNYDNGAVTVHATLQTMDIAGAAQLSGEPAHFTVNLDFDLPQLLRRLEVKTIVGPDLLHKYGLDEGTADTDVVAGAMPADLVITAAPGNALAVRLNADLTKAALGVPLLGWSKQAGEAGKLAVAARLNGQGIVSVQHIDASAPALEVHGDVANDSLVLSQLKIGRTEGAGTISWPSAAGQPWRVDFTGAALDIRPMSGRGAPAAKPAQPAPPKPAATKPSGPLWQARLSLGNFYLAAPPSPGLQNVAVNGSGQGGSLTSLTATGVAGGTPASLTVTPTDDLTRQFSLRAANAGALLKAFGAFKNLQDGTLDLSGTYAQGGAVAGTATLDKYRLLSTSILAKVLQGATIYGIPEATSGPGLAFSHLVAPFRIDGDVLTLDQARAFSASLGFTASGTIGLDDNMADIDATIVPAYAINQLPGRIPFIGRLFSGEKGGGLFSIRAKVTGSLAAPKIQVNPLSIFTPGALRNVFGMPGGSKNDSGAPSGATK